MDVTFLDPGIYFVRILNEGRFNYIKLQIIQ
jgi:hypothetical protein